MTETTLRISGMSCAHCVRSVTDALQSVPGVEDAQVDLQAGRARVRYDESRTSSGELVGAVMDEGYTAEEATA